MTDASLTFKGRIILPPEEHPECVARLIAWLCFPRVADHGRREKLAHALVAWWWRNCREAGVIDNDRMPQWVKDIQQHRNLERVEAMRPRLNAVGRCVWVWRHVRAARLEIDVMPKVTQNDFWEAWSPDVGNQNDESFRDRAHFRERKWDPTRPMIHVAEMALDRIFQLEWEWRVRRGDRGTSEARALYDFLKDGPALVGLIERAELLRVGWNAEAGLEPSETIKFEIASNVRNLGHHSDYISG